MEIHFRAVWSWRTCKSHNSKFSSSSSSWWRTPNRALSYWGLGAKCLCLLCGCNNVAFLHRPIVWTRDPEVVGLHTWSKILRCKLYNAPNQVWSQI